MTIIDPDTMPTPVARLPRDRRGYPVPWVAEWTDPDVYDPRVARTGHTVDEVCCARPAVATVRVTVGSNLRYRGPTAITTDRIGEGVPVLGKVHPGRVIRGFNEGLCNVCGHPIGAWWTFVGGRVEDGPQTFTEVPLHRDCAAYAIGICPHLVAGVRGGQLIAVTTRAASLYALGQWSDDVIETEAGVAGVNVFTAPVTDRRVRNGGGGHVLLGFVVAITAGNVMPADEWRATHAS